MNAEEKDRRKMKEYGLEITPGRPKQKYRTLTKEEQDRIIESHRGAIELAYEIGRKHMKWGGRW